MSTGFKKKCKTRTSVTPSVDSKDITSNFLQHFTGIKDPRAERTRLHLLTDIMTISLHTVSAWASEHRLILGQTKVSCKSNEITAIPALLETLDLSGCIITIDAMCTQKSIAEQIIAGNADYILSLKDNHPTLHQQVKNWFKTAQSLNFKGVDVSISQRVEKGHHRIENRTVYTVQISQLPALYEQNFALLRRIALNALDREPTFRRSIRQKSRRAAMNDQYMVSVLAASIANYSPLL